ncbi:hypothetical protein ACFQ80_06040 [Isoptericola sp. NPDC056578]|uniref:hypothetical protein n=1 Tax=Isoptericola sp. NPDC056578 TaxID=3345870 RepID=UPI00369D17F3
MHRTPEIRLDAANVEHLSSLVRWATIAEMRTAASLIARTVRETHPQATHVHLEASDQGDWLVVTSWADAQGNTAALAATIAEDVDDAAAHLYTLHIGPRSGCGAVSPDALCALDARRGIYLLTIDEAMPVVAYPPIVDEAARMVPIRI